MAMKPPDKKEKDRKVQTQQERGRQIHHRNDLGFSKHLPNKSSNDWNYSRFLVGKKVAVCSRTVLEMVP